MKTLLNLFKPTKNPVTTMKAVNPKNQDLLNKALETLNKKESIADRMVWESNVKQIQSSKVAI